MEKQKMNRKLNDLAFNFVGSEVYDRIAINGFGYPNVSFQPTGFEGRCVSSLEINFGGVYITFLVSHNNLEEVSVNIFDEDIFQIDEDNCSYSFTLPLKQLNLKKLKDIVWNETIIKSLSYQNN